MQPTPEALHTAQILEDRGTCAVTVRNGSAVLRGDCLSQSDYQAHLIVDGRVLVGNKVELLLHPSGGDSLQAIGRVESAPPQPVRGGRYELLVELFSAPTLVSDDEPTRVARFPQPSARANTFDPPDLCAGDYVVDDAVRKLSSNLSALTGGGALTLDPADVPSLSPVPGAGRTRTGAFLHVDPETDDVVALVRYRRPETFVRAYEDELQHQRVFLCVGRHQDDGTPVLLRFRLPRQTVAYTAMGVVDSSAERGALPDGREGFWVRLKSMPRVTENAFDTVYAATVPDRAAARRGARGFLSWLGLRRSA